MQDRTFEERTAAHRWAARRRAGKTDRLVLACECCPERQRSRRKPPRWGVVARAVATAVGADPSAVRIALEEAVAAEKRERQVATTGAEAAAVADEEPEGPAVASGEAA